VGVFVKWCCSKKEPDHSIRPWGADHQALGSEGADLWNHSPIGSSNSSTPNSNRNIPSHNLPNYNYPSALSNAHIKSDDAKFISRLYDKHFKKTTYNGLGNRFAHVMCIVCLCDFENGEGLRKIGACKHIFHEKCFNMWLLKDKSCPFCKENLSWEVLEKNCPNGHDWEMEKQFEIEGQVQKQVALEKEINIVSGKGGRMQIQPRLFNYGSPARGIS
jgi:hypothetical protein